MDEKEEDEELLESFNTTSEEFKSAPPIDPEKLAITWNKLVETLVADQPDLRSTLLASVPAVLPGFVLELEVSNLIQKSKVEAAKQELVPFIRKQLQNPYITLVVKVNEEITSVIKPVSPSEKFNHLAAKNSALIDLQAKFGLEPNY